MKKVPIDMQKKIYGGHMFSTESSSSNNPRIFRYCGFGPVFTPISHWHYCGLYDSVHRAATYYCGQSV